MSESNDILPQMSSPKAEPASTPRGSSDTLGAPTIQDEKTAGGPPAPEPDLILTGKKLAVVFVAL
jgi:hypothetical protein